MLFAIRLLFLSNAISIALFLWYVWRQEKRFKAEAEKYTQLVNEAHEIGYAEGMEYAMTGETTPESDWLPEAMQKYTLGLDAESPELSPPATRLLLFPDSAHQG